MMGLHFSEFMTVFACSHFAIKPFGQVALPKGSFQKKKWIFSKNHCQMGKAVKAMKASPGKVLAMKTKSKAKTEKTPAKGASPEKGKGPAKGPAMRKPASALKLPKDEGLSLEDKMEIFHKKGSQDVNGFLGSLTQQQREALWGRFARARESLKDPQCDKLWNETLQRKRQ